MLIKQITLEGIVEGRITMAFRRWKTPRVKVGTKLRTAVGVLAVDAVERVTVKSLTADDAKDAGYSTKKELTAELSSVKEGKIYRITLHHAGEDPRIALRQNAKLTKDELLDVQMRLTRMDERSNRGAWTQVTLQLIADHPETRAPDLAESLGLETKPFKMSVRKLKELGLTESLRVGYRLSPRGEVVLKSLGK